MLIKYIKSILWRAAKHLSYIEDARCLKVNSRLPMTVQRNFSYADTYGHVSVLFQADAQFMYHASHTLPHYAASKSDTTAVRLFFILSFNWKTEENLGNAVFGLKFKLRTPTTQGLVLIVINMYMRSACVTAVPHKRQIFSVNSEHPHNIWQN